MSYKAYATFLVINSSKTDEYRIRLNKVAARLLNTVSQVEIRKTDKYLVLYPVSGGYGFHLSYDNVGCPSISMSRLVKYEGFLTKDLFDGSRYAVRRGKNGDKRVFICLQEKVTEENDG